MIKKQIKSKSFCLFLSIIVLFFICLSCRLTSSTKKKSLKVNMDLSSMKNIGLKPWKRSSRKKAFWRKIRLARWGLSEFGKFSLMNPLARVSMAGPCEPEWGSCSRIMTAVTAIRRWMPCLNTRVRLSIACS